MKPYFVILTDINIYGGIMIYSTPQTIKLHKQRATPYPSYKILTLLFFFMLCCRSIAQTTIIGIITQEEIIVGADSRGIRGNDTINTVCKIIPARNMYFALSGVAQVPEVGYNAYLTAREIGRKNISIQRRINIFAETIVPRLQIAAQWIRNHDRAMYGLEIKGKHPLQIIFFGIEEGRTKLFCRYFETIEHSVDSIIVNIKKQDCPGDCNNGSMYALLRRHVKIDTILKNDSAFWVKRPLHESVNFLIENEATFSIEYVGGPIDILRIPRVGQKNWTQKKPYCEE